MQRAVPIAGFILLALFIPWFTSAATLPRWAFMSVLVPFILTMVTIRPTRGHWLLFMALCWAAASVAWSEAPLDSVFGLWQMLILAGVFCLGAELRSLAPTVKWLAVGMTLMLPVAVAQLFGSTIVPQTAVPGGLFLQTNVLGETYAVLLVACAYLRLWKLAPCMALGLLLTKDRTGLVMVAAGALYYAHRHFNRREMLHWMLALIVASLLVIVGTVFTLSKGRGFQAFGQDRVAIWQDAVAGLTWKGAGVGTFWVVHPKHATHTDTRVERSEYAHSEPLHYAFELGVGALSLAALAVWLLFTPGRELEVGVWAALLAGALFAFPFHMPVTAFLAALVAGRLSDARDFHGVYLPHERGADGAHRARHSRASSGPGGISGAAAHGGGGVPVGPQLAQAGGHHGG